jgi:hypothetical protein
VRHARQAALLVLAAGAATATAEVRLGGVAALEWAIETNGRAQKAEVIVTPELEWRTHRGFDLTAIARLRSDGYDRLEPGKPAQPAVSPWTRRKFLDDRNEVELRELYVDADVGRSYLRLGKQQIVWGRADGLKVLDLVNPQDYREFILDTFEDSRIPLWSVKWEVPLGDTWVAQWLFIPDPTFHQVPPADGRFAFSSPELVPRPPPGVDVQIEPARVPDDPLRDADAGVQLSAYLGGWDLTLNYLYHYLDAPVRSVVTGPDGATLRTDYRRSQTFGGTVSNAFGNLTLRAELGYSPKRFFATQELLLLDGALHRQATEVSSVAGVDWTGPTDTLISAQVFLSRAGVDHRAIRGTWETDLTLLAERRWRNETLRGRVLVIHDADRGDGVVTAELSYDYLSNVRVRLQTAGFYGTQRGRFGQFEGRDRVLVAIEYGL